MTDRSRGRQRRSRFPTRNSPAGTNSRRTSLETGCVAVTPSGCDSPSFDSRDFPGTGPIDNLLGLHGRKATSHSFGKGAKGAKTFGSDHFPVYVDLTIKTDAARAAKK
jgi:endonuclease/exonuclease/phosphatase family metal-dependent hydrolase